MQLVHKVLDFEVGQVDDQRRTFWAVASTDQVDRQGDSVAADGWDFANFLKNPVIPWSHDYNRPPVAKALEVKVTDGRLWFMAQFPTAEEYAFADTIFRLYRGGFLRAFSVGFAPLASEVAASQVNGRLVTGTRYLKQELYEISCVTLPANPEALAALGIASPGRPPANPLPETRALRRPPQPADDPAAAAALTGSLVEALVARRLRYHLGIID